MIRYRLDDLGWLQFEWLVQSLLKAELGVGVESWGGRADHGRDAYSAGPLNFPARHLISEGPFLFQVKFIENANAAGAKGDPTLIDSVRKEAVQIEKRTQVRKWERLRHYTLMTNAPVSGSLRASITDIISGILPSGEIHILGGNDICDLLDRQPQLRRSFPQLLSLRDLDELLRDAVSRETLERSRAAIECARDLVPVFAPTSAYDKAWKILHQHHFAVLEGPPEMGKTAIAWMVALAQLSQGWQAIVCDKPEDLFECYKNGTGQIFVADDAFGRTEYDPSRGCNWERQLDRVFRQLDPKHWLLLTSRKHILERARREMDLQGKAVDFPNPAAVLVSASELSIQEKALILYRHARAAGLEDGAKDLVRRHARKIVEDSNFTPERIRRFVSERLHELISDMRDDRLSADKILSEIREAIRNPTDRMRRSFRALPLAHKWVLICLLESGHFPALERVKQLYESQCPVEARGSFEEVFEELTESFVKYGEHWRDGPKWVNWTHPSYRDLVIEELTQDAKLQLEFLKSMSLDGIKLAISDSGGPAGDRHLPLMTSEASWDSLYERCLSVVSVSSSAEIADLLNVLCSALSQASDPRIRDRLVMILGSVCEAVREKWNKTKESVAAHELSAYCDASLLITPLPPLPDLEPSWQAVTQPLTSLLQQDTTLEPNTLDSWVQMVVTIQKNEPRFLRRLGFPFKYKADIVRLQDQVEHALEWQPILDSADELLGEAERFVQISKVLEMMSSSVRFQRRRSRELAARSKERASDLEGKACELEPEESYDDSYSVGDSRESFDVEGLFSDL